MPERALRQQNHSPETLCDLDAMRRVRIRRPYSPPRDPLSTPGIPSEPQGPDAADGAGALPSPLNFGGWTLLSVPAFVVDCGWICENSFASKFRPSKFENRP